jgi:hypothetical protein
VPPRILILAALSGDGPRAAAGLTCELVRPGAARPLAIDPALAPPVIRTASDRLAEQLALRPVAHPMAVLAHLTALLRERADATVVLEADRPVRLVELLETADLARARLDAERPAAGTSSLAAQRAVQSAPDLPTLRLAAAGGDLLRARELTTCGLVGGPHAVPGDEERARTMLALAGLPVLPELLPDAPEAAARRIAEAAPSDAPDPSFVLTAVEGGGAELAVQLPRTPQDLRAIRSGEELTLQTSGISRRVRAPRSLGRLVPGEVAAATDGLVLARFAPAPDAPPKESDR